MGAIERDSSSKPILVVIGAIVVGLVLADVLTLWFPVNWARAIAFFLGTICLRAVKNLKFSWRRIIFLALGISTFTLLFGILRDLVLEHVRK